VAMRPTRKRMKFITTNDDRISFSTDHLLSKWGFSDGALLDELLRSEGYDHMDEDSDEWFEFARRVLCEVVERFVLPQIENEIKPYRVRGNHNPMRVYDVDGCHMGDWLQEPELRPGEIEVEKQVVLETAAQLYQSRFNEDGKPLEFLVRSPEAASIFQSRAWE
jgi:hypothetical protein